MAKHGRGIICVPMESGRLEELGIYLMVSDNVDILKTAWTVSIDARHGITTGISAYDRAKTIKTLIDSKAKKEDLVRPGHIFPLRAREGGVLVRAGHTEACVDLMRLAKLTPAGAICEILGDPARGEDLGKNGRRRVEELFSVERVVPKMLEIYQSILAEERSS